MSEVYFSTYPDLSKRYMTSPELLRLMAALDTEERTIPIQALRFCLVSRMKPYNFPHVYWNDIDYCGNSIGYRTNSGQLVREYLGEEARQIILELLAMRNIGESRVFPDLPNSNFNDEINVAFRQVCKKAGLKGIDLATLKRSIKHDNSIRPFIQDLAYSQTGRKTITPTRRILAGELTHSTHKTLPASVKFRHLPSLIRKELIDYLIATPPVCNWQSHKAFRRGRNAAIAWFFDATLGDITSVAADCAEPTYKVLAAGSFTMRKIGTLCPSEAEGHVANLLAMSSGEVKATQETVYFEAGFHLTVVKMDEALSKLYRVNYEE